MAAVWAKNEATASLRRVFLLLTSQTDGSRAPRGTDYSAYIYITRDGTSAVLATGTLTNHRRALVIADDTVESVDLTDNELDLTAHGLETGDGPIRFTTSGTLPTGLATGTDYYVIAVNANSISLATSAANAYAGTEIDLTGAGSGTHTLVDTADTQRGVDGEFWYTATQAETDYDANETIVGMYGHATYWGSSTVNRASEASAFLEAIIEAGYSVADALRIIFRTHAANFSDSGTTRTFRDIADSKNSHHGTITASGRSAATIDDAT